jgi:hypothetical protein
MSLLFFFHPPINNKWKLLATGYTTRQSPSSPICAGLLTPARHTHTGASLHQGEQKKFRSSPEGDASGGGFAWEEAGGEFVFWQFVG